MKLRSLLFAATFLVGCQIPSYAATIPATEDSYGFRSKLTPAANGAATLPVDSAHQAFIYFNLNELPPGAAVRYARLRIYLPNVVRAGVGLGLHLVTGTWDESLPSAEPTFEATPFATLGPEGLAKKRFISVDVTTAVQRWIDNPPTNEGLAVTALPGASAKVSAKAILGAKEGSGTGYPAELDIELNPIPVGPASIGSTELAPNLTLIGTTSGTFSGDGFALTSLNATNIAGQLANGQLANSSLSLNLGPGLSGGNTVPLGGTLNLNNTGVLSLAAGGGVTVTSANGDIVLGSTATSANTPGSIVQRDANGDFSARAIAAFSFTGNGAALTNIPAANLTGPITSAQLTADLTLAGTTSGTFNGDGAGLTNVRAINGVAVSSLINANGVFIEFVRVGSPGNAADGATGFGVVSTTYLIGKYEVTNAQYTRFLNAVAAVDANSLYNPQMGIDGRGGIAREGTPGIYTYSVRANMGNKPVNFVGFFDAIRFCNWLHNGMPSGIQDQNTTEIGAYLIAGTAPNWAVGPRAGSARFFIPNENEWYKAAYYDPEKGSNGGYWLYPTRAATPPTIGNSDTEGNIVNSTSNIANYNFGVIWNNQIGNVSTIGSGGPGCESAFGAADMGGNMWEWLENIATGSSRLLRNGSWNADESYMRSTFRDSDGDLPTVEKEDYGFRVAKP